MRIDSRAAGRVEKWQELYVVTQNLLAKLEMKDACTGRSSIDSVQNWEITCNAEVPVSGRVLAMTWVLD